MICDSRLSDARLIEMAKDVVRGMKYLHDVRPNPILHRDLTTKVNHHLAQVE